MGSRIRIHIEVKSWIHIRIKVMRIRNNSFIFWNFLPYLFLLSREALFSSLVPRYQLHAPFHFLSEFHHKLVRKICVFLAPHMPWFIVDSSLDPENFFIQYPGTVFNKNLTFILNLRIRYCVEIRIWIPIFIHANVKQLIFFWLFPRERRISESDVVVAAPAFNMKTATPRQQVPVPKKSICLD